MISRAGCTPAGSRGDSYPHEGWGDLKPGGSAPAPTSVTLVPPQCAGQEAARRISSPTSLLLILARAYPSATPRRHILLRVMSEIFNLVILAPGVSVESTSAQELATWVAREVLRRVLAVAVQVSNCKIPHARCQVRAAAPLHPAPKSGVRVGCPDSRGGEVCGDVPHHDVEDSHPRHPSNVRLVVENVEAFVAAGVSPFLMKGHGSVYHCE